MEACKMSKISPNIWEYPSDMWKLFRKETPLGKALALALQEAYTKGHMDDQLAKTCLTGFDKAVVKVIRSTNNNVEQLEFSAKCLANYRYGHKLFSVLTHQIHGLLFLI